MKGTSGQSIIITGRKMNNELINQWKRKLIEVNYCGLKPTIKERLVKFKAQSRLQHMQFRLLF